MKKIAILALASVFAASSLWAAKGTITTASDSRSGNIVWKPAAKKYMVTYKQKNAGEVSAEYALDDVVKLDIERPAALDGALKSRNAAALKKIVEDYRMLKYDREAGVVLIDVLLKQDKADEAYKIARDIIKYEDTAAYLGDFAPAYWRTLLRKGEQRRLENCLRMAATKGDRASSANALIMRGDMICADQANPDYRRALVDAYLRVILMYRDESCAAARLEAAAKSKECFQHLNMPSHAAAVDQLVNAR